MKRLHLRQRMTAFWVVLLLVVLVACGGDAPATTAPAGQAATATATPATGGRSPTTAGTGAPTARATTTTMATTRAASPAASPTRGGTATATRAPAGSPVAGASPRAPSYPLAITDDAGRSVTLRARPQRIVSLAPSNTEILYALGLGDRVVGVDEFSDFPEAAKAKPKVGGFARTNIEQVVALGPDLILAAGITSRDTIAALEGQGLMVVVLNPKDLSGVLANISLVGQLADAYDEAARLRGQLEARVVAVRERLSGVTNRPRVFFELDPTSFYTVGPRSFIDDLITRAGGANIASDAQTPFPQLSAEQIIAKDPEVIILSDEGQGVTPQSVGQRPGWANISAVRNGRVVAINPDLTNRPGPRAVDALEEMARVLHPEAFR